MMTSGGSSSSSSTAAAADTEATPAERPSIRMLLVGSVKGQVTKLYNTLKKFKVPFDVCFCVGEFSSEDMDIADDIDFLSIGTPVYFIDSGPATQDLIDGGEEELIPGLFFLGHSGVTTVLDKRIKVAFLSGTSLMRKGLNANNDSTGAGSDPEAKFEYADRYFKSEELFEEGCYTNLCVSRLHEELELENNIDVFLTSECCNFAMLGGSKNAELINYLVSRNMSGEQMVTSAKAGTVQHIPEFIPSAPDHFPNAVDAEFYKTKCCDKDGMPKNAVGKSMIPALPKPACKILGDKVLKTGAKENWVEIMCYDSIGDLITKAEPRNLVCSFGDVESNSKSGTGEGVANGNSVPNGNTAPNADLPTDNNPTVNNPDTESKHKFRSWKTRPSWQHHERLRRDPETNQVTGGYGTTRFFAMGSNLSDHTNALHGFSFTDFKYLDLKKVRNEFDYDATPNIFKGRTLQWEDIENIRRQALKRKREAAEERHEEKLVQFGAQDIEERRRWKRMFGFSAEEMEEANDKMDEKRRKLLEPDEKKKKHRSLYHNQRPKDKSKVGRDQSHMSFRERENRAARG